MSKDDAPEFGAQSLDYSCRDCTHLKPWESVLDCDYCLKFNFKLTQEEFTSYACYDFKEIEMSKIPLDWVTLTDTTLKGLGIPDKFTQKGEPTPTIQVIREFLRESHITNMTELGVLLFGMNQDNPPEKTIHAIAHFDFDGSCDDCPFGNFGYKYISGRKHRKE